MHTVVPVYLLSELLCASQGAQGMIHENRQKFPEKRAQKMGVNKGSEGKGQGNTGGLQTQSGEHPGVGDTGMGILGPCRAHGPCQLWQHAPILTREGGFLCFCKLKLSYLQ